MERELSDLKVISLQNENQKVLEAITAKETSIDLKKSIIPWSKVIKTIRATLPKSKGVDLVNVLSYSGTSGSDISLNVKTVAGSRAPYLDVAELIESFDDSDNFTEDFVSSISKGTDENGRDVLTFLFRTKYQEVQTEAKKTNVR